MLGPAPSFVEDSFGESWVSLDGRTAGYILEHVILPGCGPEHAPLPKHATVYVGNLIRCRTGLSDPPPPKRSVNACRIHFDADMRAIAEAHHDAPLYLVAMGAEPVSHLLGPGGIRTQSKKNGRALLTFADREWHAFATYNPAVLPLDNVNAFAPRMEDHFSVLYDAVTGSKPTTRPPDLIPIAAPQKDDSHFAGLDLETFGFFETSLRTRRPYPLQTSFHPHRCVQQDRIPKHDLITTAALTFIKGKHAHSLRALADWEPGPSMFFRMDRPRDRAIFRKWLIHLTTICGSNLPYDLAMLAYCGFPVEHLTAIDSVGVSYLQCESRANRGQKELAVILGTSGYDEDEEKRLDGFAAGGPRPFRDAATPEARLYNARDTHNSIENVAALARRILRENPEGTAKLSKECIAHYSDIVHSCVNLSLNGVCLDETALVRIETKLRRDMLRLETEARDSHNLLLSKRANNGERGCKQSQESFFWGAIDEADAHQLGRPRTDDEKSPTLTHGLANFITEKGNLSTKASNRALLRILLPPDSPTQRALAIWAEHTTASKLLSSFIYPIRYHQRTRHNNDRSRIVPVSVKAKDRRPLSPERAEVLGRRTPPFPQPVYPPEERVAVYPNYYPFPMSYEGGDEGGTEQVRITAKNPAVQTWPRIIKKCITSRYGHRGRIGWLDLSQIELRVPGVMSGEPTLLENYRHGRDLHSARVFTLFFGGHAELRNHLGITEDPAPWDSSLIGDPTAIDAWRSLRAFNLWRQCAKQVNFADLFWATAATMQLTVLNEVGIVVPLDIFLRAENNRAELRPLLYDWQCSLIHHASKHGKIELPFFGQSRNFIGDTDTLWGALASTIVNFPVQSTAANILLAFQGILRRTLPPRIRMIANIYDAIGFDYRIQDEPALIDAVLRAFRELTTAGYYARICDHYGHHVPLAFESSFHAETHLESAP